MKKLLFLLLIATALNAQTYQNIFDNVLHGAPLSISFHILSGTQTAVDKDSVWIQFPTRTAAGKIDTLANESITTSGFVAKTQTIWNGHARVSITITNVNLATDSLQILVYALDQNGVAIANDYVYCNFGTPPDFSIGVVTKSWTTAKKYSAMLTGAFPIGTRGLLFILNINDATANHTGTILFEVDYR